jgi:farnesyl-diphosphate farnesyltransferase
MSKARLTGGLLRSVSRSFYLSIRVLPAVLREPIAMAYLLARISDTIADTETAPSQVRLRRIGDFEGLVRGIPSPYAINAIQRDIQPDHAGEKELIAAMPQILACYEALDMWEWKETSDLLASIIRGQSNDLETFADPGSIIALPDATALEDYIYLVAGCVGEWWTRLCFHHLPNYSRISEFELAPLSDAFGKSLQLVNILRDMPSDLASGRCYLPASELSEIRVTPDMLMERPFLAQPVYEHWQERTRALLEKARMYIISLRPRRLRMACYIPWRLAGKTLDLIEENRPLHSREKVKVPRSMVRKTMWESLSVAFSNKLLTR